MTAANLSAERRRELLHYDMETGVITWRVRSNSRVTAGDVAGYIRSNGYIAIQIDGRLYFAHRLAWFFVMGEWPKNQIDHIDGKKTNNRFANLREATNAENGQNQRKAQSDNKSSGLLGVSWHNPSGNWRARISLDGKERCLGYFHTAESAHAAYIESKRRIHAFGTI